MIPSIDDRLDSIVRALQEAILPALAPTQPLAIEQVHLTLAHIGVIRGQLDQAPRFELDEAETSIKLAENLLAMADGGENTMSAAMALRSVVEAVALDNAADIRRATHEVGSSIERLIRAVLVDGAEGFRKISLDQVLSSGRISAMANRRWNLAAGFEAPEIDVDALGAT